MIRSAHAFMLGLTLSLLSSSGFASSVENKGKPEPNVTAMTTYGVAVATRTGLKAVIPPGWQLFVHRSVTLPETMTWKVGDPWTQVLTEFAVKSDISVLIDWDKHVVMLRTPSIAVEEGARREEIEQAATTPLPAFSDSLTANQEASLKAKEAAKVKREQKELLAVQQKDKETAARLEETRRQEDLARQKQLAEVQRKEREALDRVPVIRTNPTPTMVTAQAEAAKKRPGAPLASTSEFRYTGPVSLNKPSVRNVAQGIANRFNLRLVYAAPEATLKGPVTLLGDSPEQDARLLEKAVGIYGPVVLEVSPSEKVLRVLHRKGAGSVVYDVPSAATEPVIARDNAPEPVSEVAPSAKEAPAKPAIVFVLNEKEPLEDALVRLTRANGYTLEWKVQGGFEANRSMTFDGNTLAEVLSKVLPKLGLSADIYTRDKHIVVRPGDAARDR